MLYHTLPSSSGVFPALAQYCLNYIITVIKCLLTWFFLISVYSGPVVSQVEQMLVCNDHVQNASDPEREK